GSLCQQKNWGAGQSPANKKNLLILLFFFPPSLCGLRQNFCPPGTLCESTNILALYFWNMY
ncbi:hypothetical protein, partial [Brachyspira pilosicoli]|uniref:hypothetical protein n=1 Tax=Brachyspira pilosicoli TaxID=52584 RepID=UPI0024911098